VGVNVSLFETSLFASRELSRQAHLPAPEVLLTFTALRNHFVSLCRPRRNAASGRIEPARRFRLIVVPVE
jgi:hypothetical protein